MKETDRKNGKIIIALARTMENTHRKSTEMLRLYGLTPPQFAVLEALWHKGDLTVQEIIDAVLSTSGNMTVVIKNLEKRDLILRKENPNDKRSFIIMLTDEGRKLIEEIFPLHMELIGEKLNILSDEEKTQIITILKKIK